MNCSCSRGGIAQFCECRLGSFAAVTSDEVIVERLVSSLQERRADQFKTALCAITRILDEVEADRLENDVDIDVDELIAGIRKQLRTAWGL